MTTKKLYNLSFKEALDIIISGGAVKGNEFAPGIYLKLNQYGQLVTVDANSLYEENTTVYIDSISKQSFRELTIMTLNELKK